MLGQEGLFVGVAWFNVCSGPIFGGDMVHYIFHTATSLAAGVMQLVSLCISPSIPSAYIPIPVALCEAEGALDRNTVET